MTKNVAGWTGSNTKDQASVGYLKYLFASDADTRFLSTFNDLDTVPNLDGQLYIGKTSEKGTRVQPVATFAVQIKSFPSNYSNENTKGTISDYKYSCDTGAFYTVIEKVTLDPVLLFLVDANSQRVFWRYLSVDECVNSLKRSTQKKCTVYFNDEDEIKTLSEVYDSLLEIAEERQEATADIVVKNDFSPTMRDKLINAAIELNRTMDNDLRFIKESLFPGVKQFGLSLNHKKDSVILKIFCIVENSEGDLVRSFQLEELPPDAKRSFFDILDPNDIMAFFRNRTTFDPSEIVNSFCKKLIESFSRKSYLPANYLSNEIIAEIIYWYLDYLAEHCSSLSDNESTKACYIDDTVSLEKVSALWKAMNDAVLLHYDSLNITFDPESTLLIDPLKENETFLDEYLHLALECPIEQLPCSLGYSGVFPYHFVGSVIDEATDRGVLEITRPWHKPEGERAIAEYRECSIQPQIYFWYTVETYYKELEKLIGEIQQAYRYAIRSFPNEAKQRYEKPGMNVFYLEKTRDSGLKILHRPGSKFETSYTYEEAPSDPFACGADVFTRGLTRFDFSRAPLYSSLEYFLIKAVCKYHNVHCVVQLGEHIGNQFRSK